MCSPSPLAEGRSCSDRWLESSPSSTGTAEPRPSSYLQELCSAPPLPAGASPRPSLLAVRPPLRSEICRMSVDGAHDDWLLAHRRKRHCSSRSRRPHRGPGDAPRQPPSWLREGECPRCLSPGHPRLECRRDIRCGRCRFFGHKARDCPLRSATASSSTQGDSPPPLCRRGSASGSSPEESASPPARPTSSGSFGHPTSSRSASVGPSRSDGSVPASSRPRTAFASPTGSTSVAATSLSGHPARHPAGAICYLPRSAELVAAELDLERALLTSVAGCRLGITREVVFDALRTRYGLTAHEFSVHIHAYDGFLVKFSSAASRARVTAGGLRTGGFRLLFTPWSRSRDAIPVKARFLVSIKIMGTPDHAWHQSSAEFLLSSFCRVKNLAPETKDASDMSVFHLTAWTINPDGIPRLSELLVPEPDAVADKADPTWAERLALGLMRFPVEIHAVSSVDYSRPAPPLRESWIGVSSDNRTICFGRTVRL